MKILLRGYYGFGNLGDDILMLTSCEICKWINPDSEITVMTTQASAPYIKAFSKGLVQKVVPLGSEPNADLIIHGGGGVFYDFQKGNGFYRLLNITIKLLGYSSWSRILNYFRSMKGWNMNKRALRVGMGIGLGSYTPDSKKFYQKSAELGQFHWLFLRDTESFELIKELKLIPNLRLSTDLAFLKEYWVTKLDVTPHPKNIGFVLKYWPQNPGYILECKKAISELVSRGYKITIFLFERLTDQPLVESLADLKLRIWDPQEMTLQQYLSLLASQRVMVTSRAHGAILSAAFRIPSICLGLEPKLKTIHEMLPDATDLLELPLSFRKFVDAVEKAKEVDSNVVDRDFQRNYQRLTKGLIELKEAANAHQTD